jgi:hypothetical protein|uniref:Uncharacterized protein n=1 Tax=Populus trichocarpa TaxID=3694 RepID=A0A2K2AGD4_POPTR
MQQTAKKCIPKQGRGDGTGKSKTWRKSNTSKVINQSITQGHHIDAAKILLVSFLIKKAPNYMKHYGTKQGRRRRWEKLTVFVFK